MAVFRMNALAQALAALGVFAPGAVAGAGSLSAYASTEVPVTQEIGSVTSAGSILHSFSVCSVVHETACGVVTSTSSAASNSYQTGPPVPGQGGPSSYGEGEAKTKSGAAGQPGQPSQTAAASGGNNSGAGGNPPGYSAPAPSGPSQTAGWTHSGHVVPTSVITSGGAGNTFKPTALSSSAYGGASNAPSGSGEVGSGGPSATESGATGTPITTSGGAAVKPDVLAGALVGAAGLAIAMLF